MLLLPALNQTIDSTTARTVASQVHPPLIVYVLLMGLALVLLFRVACNSLFSSSGVSCGPVLRQFFALPDLTPLRLSLG